MQCVYCLCGCCPVACSRNYGRRQRTHDVTNGKNAGDDCLAITVDLNVTVTVRMDRTPKQLGVWNDSNADQCYGRRNLVDRTVSDVANANACEFALTDKRLENGFHQELNIPQCSCRFQKLPPRRKCRSTMDNV